MGELGDTREFVLGRGWTQVDGMAALQSADGSLRFFFLLETHPDDPGVQIEEAWRTFFESLPPGTGARLLYFSFPEEEERLQFVRRLQQAWPTNDGPRQAWKDDLLSFLLDAPLPFHRQLLLEVSLSPRQPRDFLLGLPHLFARFGVTARPALPEEVEALAHKIFRPEV